MKITRKHVFSFIFLAIFSVIQFIVLAATVQPVLADDSLFNKQTGVNEIGGVFGNNKTDIRIIVANIIIVVLGFLAAIFLALIVYSGFRYMTAAGNEEQTKKAIAQIRDAVIGLLIVLASWAIAAFVLRTLSRAVLNSATIL
jgi:hypothetical protein